MTGKSDSIKSLRILYEISCLVRSDNTLEDKFLKGLEMVQHALEFDSGSLFLYNQEKKSLEEVATIGARVDLIETIEFELGSGLSAWIAKQRDSVLLPDVRNKSEDGFRSFISVPLVSGEKLIGVLNAGHTKPNYFSEKHLQFLEIIALELAYSIERARFEHEIVEKNAELQKANEEIQKQQKQIVEMERQQLVAQLAVTLNHEINNPLTSVMGNVELLLIANPDMDEKIRNKLEVVLTESKRIQEIVNKFTVMKKRVLKSYLNERDEKMIDIDSSATTE